MKAEIYYQMIVGDEDNPKGWAEDLKGYRLYGDNAAVRQAKAIVYNFNVSLKKYEGGRHLIRVEKVEIKVQKIV